VACGKATIAHIAQRARKRKDACGQSSPRRKSWQPNAFQRRKTRPYTIRGGRLGWLVGGEGKSRRGSPLDIFYGARSNGLFIVGGCKAKIRHAVVPRSNEGLRQLCRKKNVNTTQRLVPNPSPAHVTSRSREKYMVFRRTPTSSPRQAKRHDLIYPRREDICHEENHGGHHTAPQDTNLIPNTIHIWLKPTLGISGAALSQH
jgi:hypothetical protein